MINLLCPINNLGYGVAGLNILAALQLKTEVALFPISLDESELTPEQKAVVKTAYEQGKLYDGSAPSIRIYHQNQLAEHVGNGLKIGFPFFELDRFTKEEHHHLLWQEQVFTASKWGKEVLLNCLPGSENHISVIPLGVDRSIFHEGLFPLHKLGSTTVFLNCGKWEVRKGHDVLIRAFNAAFEAADDVALLMCPHNPFIGEQNTLWAKAYKESKLGEKIRISGRKRSQVELAQWMAQADCGVFPTRAEGWNLEPIELLSMGKKVIATNYSGQTEYLTHDNSLLVDIDELEDAHDGIWFHGQGKWAKYGDNQFEQLVSHMRNVHTLKQTGNISVNIQGIQTAQAFSWDNTASKIIEALF
jgi:glycosyltransferase involved in cell wall biosynthesis